MSEERKSQSRTKLSSSKAKLGSQPKPPSTKKFRAAGQPAGITSASMLGENRYNPNPAESSTTDPFAPLQPYPHKHKMDKDNRSSSLSDNDDAVQPNEGSLPSPAPGKKTRGRVKIQMEYIQNKLRRYTTFSKRKSGIMKKAYELSTLTGTQVMLLVASETGHVYTFATPKLQPMITSEAGKALIQTCLHQPDVPVVPMGGPTGISGEYDMRMSAAGYEETELGYQVPEDDFKGGMDPTLHTTISSGMPTILNAPLVSIPPMMQMPGFITSMPEATPNMVPVQQLTSSPQAMSPHHSSPPSYSPPHQTVGSPRNNGYQPTSYPTSPSATPYSMASHMPHHSVMMDPDMSSPSLSHHHGGIDYDRSPSRSPHRYSPPVSSHSQVLYAAPNGSPPMRHSPIMRT